MTKTVFKPDFDGARPAVRTTGPEKQALRLGKPDLVRRLHDAMLTLTVQDAGGPSPLRAAGAPPHLIEFSDRVGEEEAETRRARFRPTSAQVSDLPAALALLDGLTRPLFQIVMLRALHEFSREHGGQGDWPWKKIAGRFGLSEAWAQSAYEAAIVQAARRAGVLPLFPTDYGVFMVAVWVDRAWLTHLGTAADPRQAVATLNVKSPVRLEQAVAVWVAGQPVAKRIAEEVKISQRGLLSHGSWYKANPDSMTDHVVATAQSIKADWLIEDLPTRRLA